MPDQDPSKSASRERELQRVARESKIQAARRPLQEPIEAQIKQRESTANSRPDTPPSIEATVDNIILDGLRLQRELTEYTGCLHGKIVMYELPAGRDLAAFTARCRVWLATAEEAMRHWRPDARADVHYTSSVIESGLKPGMVDASRQPLMERFDEILDELRSILPVLAVRSVEESQSAWQQLTGDELNHAEQLLAIPGCHEEAILRAAGVIAGVVLERHLVFVIRRTNANLPPTEKPYDLSKKNRKKGISSYVHWLIGQTKVASTERHHLERLAHIRTCCDHAPNPDANLRAPTQREVQDLIDGARRYTKEIEIPAVP